MRPLAGEIDPDALAQEWKHSNEEDSDDVIVYRPARTPMPPARGRRAFSLAPDGTLKRSGPGPDDRPRIAEGTWSLDGKTLTLHVEGRPDETYQIESMTEDKLVLRRAET